MCCQEEDDELMNSRGPKRRIVIDTERKEVSVSRSVTSLYSNTCRTGNSNLFELWRFFLRVCQNKMLVNLFELRKIRVVEVRLMESPLYHV